MSKAGKTVYTTLVSAFEGKVCNLQIVSLSWISTKTENKGKQYYWAPMKLYGSKTLKTKILLQTYSRCFLPKRTQNYLLELKS